MGTQMKRLLLAGGIMFLMVGSALGEEQGLPDYELSIASMAYSGPEVLTLLIVPDGSGGYFSTARTPTGASADATITLVLLDSAGFPIANYPQEDIWLQSADSSIPFCANYWACIPDMNTNAAGETRWLLGPRGGGSHEGPVMVYINNSPLTSSAGLPLSFNSPDINGDRAVGLSDVALMAADLYGGYQFRSDLHRDGVINLSDVIPLAKWMNRRCS